MPTHAPGSDFSSRALTHTARRARRTEAKMGVPASVRVVLVAVVWCALACGAVAHARSADDWLRDWLGNLRVDIPDQVLKQGGLSVALTDLSCGSFEVGSLRSETNVSSVTASLDVNGAACACSGRWEIRSMSLSGRLAARVNDSDVAMTVALSPGGANASLPSSAKVTACSARVRIADLDFKGSGANVLRALVPLLKSSAESAAASAAKSALAPLVADKVTAAMRAGDERIAFSLVPHEPLRDVVPEELVPPMETKNAFDWRAEPAIAAARIAAEAGGGAAAASAARLANLFAGGNATGADSDIADRLFPNASASNSETVACVPSAWLPGAMADGGIPPLAVSLGAFGSAEIAVENAAAAVSLPPRADNAPGNIIVHGPAPDPKVPTAMTFAVALPTDGVAPLAATVAVRVSLANASAPVVERATARARVVAPALSARLAVAADKAAFSSLAFEQRGVPGCVAPAVRAVEVTAVELAGAVSEATLARSGAEEARGSLVGDVYAVAGDIASLLTEVYSETLFAAASAAAGGPGRDAVNKRAAAVLETAKGATCASPRADAATSPGGGARRVSEVAGTVAAVCLFGALAVAVLTERRALLAKIGVMESSEDDGRGGAATARRARARRAAAKAARAAERKFAKAKARAAADAAAARDAAIRTAKAKAAKEDARRRELEAAGEPVPLSVVPEWDAYELEDALLEADRVEREFDPSAYLSDDGGSDFVPPDGESDDEDGIDDDDDDSAPPAVSPSVPLWVRRALPLAVLGNVALFVSSNAAAGADVLLSATAADDAGTVRADAPPIFEFTLANSVTDMWAAGVYPLSALIAVLSGGWPYLKLVAIAAAWCSPDWILACLRVGRASTLRVVDALGKWSLIDAFVMVLFRVAFRFRAQTRDDDAWAAVDVRVAPKWGFHAFVLATVVSLGVGHVARRCASGTGDARETGEAGPVPECLNETFGASDVDESAVEVDAESLETLLDAIAAADTPARAAEVAASGIGGGGTAPPERLDAPPDAAAKKVATWRLARPEDARGMLAPVFAYVFAVPAGRHPSRDEDDTVRIARGVAGATTFALAWAAVAFVVAGSVPAIEFEFRGLAGAALGDARARRYSLFSLIDGGSAWESQEPISTARMVLCAFAVLAPLVHIMSVAILWLAPATPRERRALLAAAETAAAWASLDVFLVSAVAAVAQISRFAGFIVGDACDAVDAAVAALESAAKRQSGDADPFGLKGQDVCFDVRAKTKGGVWMLVVAALSAGAATRFVAKHAERAVERETLQAKASRVVAHASVRVSEEPVNLSVATMQETPPLTPEVTTPYYPDV